jgi:hypothetical protein
MENKYFSSGEKAFYLSYLTKVPLNRADQLNREEEEVWNTFQSEAERRQMNAAIIAPTTKNGIGPLAFYKYYNYVYRKQNGNWISENRP